MAFIRDRIIETGRCKGLDLGRNFKRGTPVISYDFIVWRRPGHRTAGVDIARGYDATRSKLQLSWQVHGSDTNYGHPFYAAYNVPSLVRELDVGGAGPGPAPQVSVDRNRSFSVT